MHAEQLINSIFQRHARTLQLMGLDTAPVRMSLHLALAELAERIVEDEAAAPVYNTAVALQLTVPAQAPQAELAPPPDPLPTTPAELPAETSAEPAVALPPKRRGGRQKGTKNKTSKTQRAQEMVAAIAEHVANGAELVPDGVQEMPFTGRLRKEETVVRQHNGLPVQVTRQYIELR